MPNVRLRLLDNAGSEKSKKFEYPPPSFYKFGPFTLDSRQKLLLREGVEVPLRPKVFDVLVALVQNRGQIMEKDRLMQTVWPESFVEEANLAQSISVLRKTLRDGKNGEKGVQYIETASKRGYRFVAQVQELAAEQVRKDPAISSPAVLPRTWIWTGTIIVLIAMAVVIVWISEHSHPQVSTNYHIRPFATDLPAQMYPTWSPDGHRIAFVGEQSGTRRLKVQDVNGAHALSLTAAGLQLNQRQFPFWSPDANFIYFFVSGSNLDSSLYRIAAAGGDAVLIQSATAAAAISPDARTLITLSYSEDSKWRIWTASPPEAPRRLYQPEPFASPDYANRPTLAFAPDGRSILLAINLPALGPRYWLLPWPPGPPKRIFERMPYGRPPNFAWMRDSRHLAFFASRKQELFLADTRSGRYWATTTVDRRPDYPSFSPDGTRIAYEAGLSHTDVIAVPLNGDPVEPILDSSISEEMPACSRISGQLVYVSDRSGSFEIFIHNQRDQTDRPLFSSTELFGSDVGPTSAAPVFSPDGKQVAFRGALNRSLSGILVASAAGDTPARIVAQSPMQFAPCWSPDGQWLAFVQLVGDSYHLVKSRVDGMGGTVDLMETMRDAGATMILPEWSPSGDWIACGNSQSQLTLVRPDGRAARKLGGSGPVTWSRDGRILYQIRYEDRSLVAIEVASGKVRLLRDLGELMPFATTEPARRLTLSHDGTRVVYSVLRPREEIWILEGIQPARPWLARLWPW